MTDSIEGALWGAFVGGVLGIIGTYFATREARSTALETIRLSEFNKAAATFYDAFHETLMAIENQNLTSTDTDSLVKKDIEKQISAVQRFKFHLPETDRTAFLNTWEAYERDCRAAKFASLDPSERSKREKMRRLALYHLYKILKFAGYEKSEYSQQPQENENRHE